MENDYTMHVLHRFAVALDEATKVLGDWECPVNAAEDGRTASAIRQLLHCEDACHDDYANCWYNFLMREQWDMLRAYAKVVEDYGMGMINQEAELQN